ncbi:hypothetical protein HW555_009676 [Spodoptera exigua]|uniref:Mitochondrial import inner membrane translocase subunit Tim23 n=1 Tax=Spodoptera exigua TaxID=7107 RepID=A0A835L2A7_SPOEX|nr:hypothetical protein HW555_009676 [Spodoptera exigua]
MSLFGDILSINKNEEKTQQAGSSLSPYLNFDPHIIPKMQPEFLYPDDSHMASTARRSNVALPIIGMSFMTGSGLGGMAGLYKGLRATTLAGQTGKVRRTQVINYIMKQGTNTGCTLGIIASFYSCIALGVTWLRDKEGYSQHIHRRRHHRSPIQEHLRPTLHGPRGRRRPHPCRSLHTRHRQ